MLMAIFLVTIWGGASALADTIDFDSVENWAGTGANSALFVMDWNDGKEAASLKWGYRWDGEASGEEMIKAIAAMDERLFIRLEHWNNFGGSWTLYGAGYDLDGKGFTYVPGTGGDFHYSNDDGHPEDPGDHYQEGWLHTGYWSYHLSSDNGATWSYSNVGMTGRELSDGDIDGWRFEPFETGGDYGIAAPPDTPVNPPSENKSPFATKIVETHGTFGTGSGLAYSHPDALVGKPSVRIKDGAGTMSRIKMVEPAWILGPDGEPLITSIDDGAFITVAFDHDVLDDPNNPYGIDFIVYGNAFFTAKPESGCMFDDTTDMSTAYLTGGTWCEKVMVSVSPDGITWYHYKDGPYGDTLFPTQAHKWDVASKSWTDEEMAWTRPVDPDLSLSNFADKTVEDAMRMYKGSAGGTGFDLKISGFSRIRYVRVTGWPGDTDGAEIDAFSDVAPIADLDGDLMRDGRRALRDVTRGLKRATVSTEAQRDEALMVAMKTLTMLTAP